MTPYRRVASNFFSLPASANLLRLVGGPTQSRSGLAAFHRYTGARLCPTDQPQRDPVHRVASNFFSRPSWTNLLRLVGGAACAALRRALPTQSRSEPCRSLLRTCTFDRTDLFWPSLSSIANLLLKTRRMSTLPQPAAECRENIASEVSPTSRRLPSLDGWRAISIVMVLGSHCPRVRGHPAFFDSTFAQILLDGDLGVRCFFIISGLLITSLILAEHRSDRAHQSPAFLHSARAADSARLFRFPLRPGAVALASTVRPDPHQLDCQSDVYHELLPANFVGQRSPLVPLRRGAVLPFPVAGGPDRRRSRVKSPPGPHPAEPAAAGRAGLAHHDFQTLLP